MTAQQKRYLLLSSLVDFLLRVTMHFLLYDTYREAYNRSSRSLYILLRLPLRFPRSSIPPHILSLPAHLGNLTKQLDLNHTTYDTPSAVTVYSPSRTWTQIWDTYFIFYYLLWLNTST